MFMVFKIHYIMHTLQALSIFPSLLKSLPIPLFLEKSQTLFPNCPASFHTCFPKTHLLEGNHPILSEIAPCHPGHQRLLSRAVCSLGGVCVLCPMESLLNQEAWVLSALLLLAGPV